MRAWVAALLIITACGTAQGSAPLPLPSPPTAALAAWKDFPASASPRPIIIFERALERIGPSGFTSEPDRKLAWSCYRFAFAAGVQLSETAPARAMAGGTPATYPSIGSARAWAQLLASRRPSGSGQCATFPPFLIKSVRWGTAAFLSDRGATTMSAWLFDVAEIDAYLAYSALDPSAFWGGGVNPGGGRGARITADGRTLEVQVGNAQPGPCGNSYTAAAAESGTAVAVAVKAYPHASPGDAVVCDLVLRLSYISVPLKAPLGGRVLVDESGRVSMVCRETGC
jgi:hypothetical protein